MSSSSEDESQSESSQQQSSSENESSVSDSSDDQTPKSKDENSKIFSSSVRTKLGMKNLKYCVPSLTTEELISPDNQLWIVTVPRKLNANKLHDANLSLTESSSLEVENEKYETIFNEKPSTMAFILPNKKGEVKLAITKIEGIITVVGDVDLPAENHLTIPNNQAASAPQMNFKRRHPIHGTDLNSDKIQSANVPIKKIKKEVTQMSAKKRKSKSKH